jgi:hypothetical protein
MSYTPTSQIDKSDLYVVTTSASWFSTPTKKRGTSRKKAIVGKVVEPGRVLSKEERKRRNDSAATLEIPKSLQQKRTEDQSFRAKLATWMWNLLCNLPEPLEDPRPPQATASTCRRPTGKAGVRLHNARHLGILFITFLIVLGSLQSMLDYLLNATRASAQCTSTTIFSTVTVSVPVTYTYTESIFVTPTACTSTPADVAAAAATDLNSASTALYVSTSQRSTAR